VRALGVLLVLVLPAAVHAQGGPRLPAFRPEATFGVVFDSNVFMRAIDPAGDVFMRLTPGFDLVHESPQLRVNGTFRFDAERYQERSDLNEAVARNLNAIDVTWRPNTRFGLITRAAYERTQTPLDLNTATGLTGGRMPAWRTDFSVGLENSIRPNRRVTVGADFSYYDLQTGADSSLRTFRVRYAEDLNPRSQLYANYRLEQREFLPGGLFISHVTVGGWSYRLTPTLMLTFEGGPRVVEGTWSPEVNVSATQVVNTITTFSAGYSHTQDVAVGVVGLITVDRVTTSVAMRRSRFWELILSAGAYRNVQNTFDSVAYDLGVSVGRLLTEALWLVGSVNRNYNDMRSRGAAPDSRIERNWAMISIRFQPYRPR
jgi:hypothetical protein